jgi:hypothetical protein
LRWVVYMNIFSIIIRVVLEVRARCGAARTATTLVPPPRLRGCWRYWGSRVVLLRAFTIVNGVRPRVPALPGS